ALLPLPLKGRDKTALAHSAKKLRKLLKTFAVQHANNLECDCGRRSCPPHQAPAVLSERRFSAARGAGSDPGKKAPAAMTQRPLSRINIWRQQRGLTQTSRTYNSTQPERYSRSSSHRR